MTSHRPTLKQTGIRTVLCLFCILTLSACTRDRITRAEIAPVQLISHPGFQNIDSVVVDQWNNIYVSDIFSVKIFDKNAAPIGEIGKQGTEDGQFLNEVIGLAINSKNELYAVDQDQTQVQVFDLEGNFLRRFGQKGSADGEFIEPQGITIDTLDLVYISDKLRNNVQVFSRGGEYLYQFGHSGIEGAGFNEPESMVVHQNRLFVADEENRRIQIFDLRGQHLGHLPHSGIFDLNPQLEASLDDVAHHTDVEKKFHRFLDGDIEGLAVDNQGLLYALNEDAGEIMVFQKEIMIGIFTSQKPILSGDGMAFDAQFKHLYVVDQGNSRIQVFETSTIHKILGIAAH